jgi:hypothetical protein
VGVVGEEYPGGLAGRRGRHDENFIAN